MPNPEKFAYFRTFRDVFSAGTLRKPERAEQLLYSRARALHTKRQRSECEKMERRRVMFCIGIALLLVGAVLLFLLVTRPRGLDGNGLTFVEGIVENARTR